MAKKRYLTWNEILGNLALIDREAYTIYGVPKGGMIAAGFLKKARNTSNPELADIILDDLVDSGATRDYYQQKYPNTRFLTLYSKDAAEKDIWYVFPWEADHPAGEEGGSMRDNIVRQLQYIGEDPEREGLKETPDRIIRSWDETMAGYKQDPTDVFKIFEEEQIGGLVYMKGIEFFSTCEHHWLPFSGIAHIGYIPNGPVIGASKLSRLLDVYARRLQIQERLAEQVTDALMEHLKPLGAACILEAKHFCMACRGVKKANSKMGYSSMKGVFLDKPEARLEFITLVTS